MVDVLGVLIKKREALLQRKQAVKNEFMRQTAEINNEIGKVDGAIETLKDAMKDFLCPVCRGVGEIRICDAAGQMEDVTCPDCHGTGVKQKKGGE